MQNDLQDIYRMLREIQETQVALLERINSVTIRKIDPMCFLRQKSIPKCQFSEWIQTHIIDDDILSYFNNNNFSSTFIYTFQKYNRLLAASPITDIQERNEFYVFEQGKWIKMTREQEKQWICLFHKKLLAAVCHWRDAHLEIIYNNNLLNESYNKMILKLTSISLLRCSFASMDIRKTMCV